MRIHAHHVPSLLVLGLLAGAGDATTTTAGAKTTMLDACVEFMGDTNTPTWYLSVPEKQLKSIGVLREGDKITIKIISPNKELAFAKWSQKCRRYSHETCRGWLFFKRCTRHYEVSTDQKEQSLKPIDFNTTVTFVPDVPDPHKLVEDKDKWTFDSDNYQIETNSLKGPRLLQFSGRYSMNKPANEPPQRTKCEEFVNDSFLGKNGPHKWFMLQVSVVAPELDD